MADGPSSFVKGSERPQPSREVVGMRKVQVKNRAPAPIQITAEQILRESRERAQEQTIKAPRQRITDEAELQEFRLRKRKEYEDEIRRQAHHMGTWIKYAQFEEDQRDFVRARSVFERALDIDYRGHNVWLKYAEMEMRNKFVNHARNVWDRAVTLLPRVDQFWFKYAYMEEMLGNVAATRQIFERWMQWEPDDAAWTSYIKFELRYEEVARARGVFERYVVVHPSLRAYLKYAKFEGKQGQKQLARQVYERALVELPEAEKGERLYVEFAHFEERSREHERARAIYQFALDNIPRGAAEDLYQEFVAFEKRHGEKEGIEGVIVGKRRFQYEEAVGATPLNYDAWFDYVRLEEAEGDAQRVREVYERAIANVPPAAEKRFWRRYIYLWINYALFEELVAEDPERCRAVYTACLSLIPHRAFTFGKLWLMAAHFEIRCRDVAAARKLLGRALGLCPKDSLFKGYIQLELQMGNVDRCRTLYGKYLEWAPHSCYAWAKFAELETMVGEEERARSIYELAIGQPSLDMPELIWKAYIDAELAAAGSGGDVSRPRALYERLLERTQHVKVWISYGQLERSAGNWEACRAVFQRGYDKLRAIANSGGGGGGAAVLVAEERVQLLDAWLAAERACCNAGDDSHRRANLPHLQAAEAKVPKKIKKRRMVTGEDGAAAGWEEYYDYIFPDDDASKSHLKLLQMAQKWKQGNLAAGGGGAAAGSAAGAGGVKRKAEDDDL